MSNKYGKCLPVKLINRELNQHLSDTVSKMLHYKLNKGHIYLQGCCTGWFYIMVYVPVILSMPCISNMHVSKSKLVAGRRTLTDSSRERQERNRQTILSCREQFVKGEIK